ncbi:hypothetical protein AB0C27_40725 [Nonomuraea sp. NPDC048882]|uniref:hypothetical protein n=1 Tax=Nonomuraea sp. NPDC048882 TaxID=3154347 RepID=UPI0033F44B9D
MSTILANPQSTDELRARLDQLMAATRDLTDSAHGPLTHTLNLLDDIADQTPGLDYSDWSSVWLYATADVENMHANRLAGHPFEASARELKGSLEKLAGIIYRALDKTQARQTSEMSAADQVIMTLAIYADEHSCDIGGGHQSTVLLAALLHRLFDITPHHAIHLAKHAPHDDRVKAAGQARTEILDRIEHTRLAAQDNPWTPQTGDTVTHNGTDGTWIFQQWEDDDTAWIHRPDARTFPAIGRAGSGLTDLAGWRDEPEESVLVAVAELRPANTAAEVAV